MATCDQPIASDGMFAVGAEVPDERVQTLPPY